MTMSMIFDFLNSNSGAIQAILVLVLVSVTIWYAISTKTMARIMAQQYVSNMQPYLYPAREVDRNFDPKDNKTIQLKFLFTNVGNAAVHYFVEEFTLENTSINPPKVNTILFPQQKGFIHSNLYHSKSNVGQGDGLKGSIKVIFWTNGIHKERYYFQRRFTLAPQMVTFSDSEDFGVIIPS